MIQNKILCYVLSASEKLLVNKIFGGNMTKKKTKQIAALAVGTVMLASAGGLLGSTGIASAATMLVNNGVYTLDYNSYEDAYAAAQQLNEELSAEGSVMLKNDGTLPLTGNESVSVFGVWETTPMNNNTKSPSFSTAFANAGFKTNNVLADFYKNYRKTSNTRGAIGSETTDFGQGVKNSFDLYNDLAVIVVSRAGGEMADLDTVINEEERETYLGEDQGWEHDDLFVGTNTTTPAAENAEGAKKFKHLLELNDSEQALVKYVEQQNFKHIVFVINATCAMETYNLEQDNNINAIFWVGRTGETGVNALPQIIKGAVNPSGKTSDEWYKDFSADPVWQNTNYNGQHFGNAVNNGYTFTDPISGKENQKITKYANNYMYPDGTPTANLAAPRFNGLNGLDQEEDIYYGYKYVETYYQDVYNGVQPKPAKYSALSEAEAAKKWYEDTVTHAFGSGKSYTDFSINIKGVHVNSANGEDLKKVLADDLDGFKSSVTGGTKTKQKYKKLFIEVEVENVGKVYSGKEVVEIYSSAPYYKGGLEKPAMTLIGFGKTKNLKPGKKQTLYIEANVQDMASYDYSDANHNGTFGYELEYGDYTLYASNTSHVDLATINGSTNDAQDKYDFTIGTIPAVTEVTAGTTITAIYQQLDDYTDNVVSNQFSDRYSTDEAARSSKHNSLRQDDKNNSSFKINNGSDAGMTLMNRSEGFVASFPAPPTTADMTLSQQFIDTILLQARFDADFTTGANSTLFPDEGQEWYVADTAEFAGWTQAAETNKGQNGILLADMAGIDFDSEDTVTSDNELINGLTGKKAWEKFMNQLSWAEISNLVESCNFTTAAIPSINKPAGSDQDRPNMLDGTYNWCDEVVIASTWNTELARKEGIITANLGLFHGNTGWYGPGMNIHRSAFSGRNNDYYSQDGIHAGYMGIAVVQGAQSRGLNCFLKHFAGNDQESTRNGWALFFWGSEQAWRENQFKPFQMCMQEGGAAAAMCAFTRLATESCSINYRLLNNVANKEWGFKGCFITDAQPGTKATASPDMMIRSGTTCFLRNNNVTDNYNRWYVSGTWDPDMTRTDGGKGGVKVGGDDTLTFYYNNLVTNPTTGEVGANYTSSGDVTDSWTQYYYTRISAQKILYMAANSSMARNGVNAVAWQNGADLTWSQGVALNNASVAMSAEALDGRTDVTYAVTQGNLPAGVTLNASTGALSGTPTAAGEFSFTVTCTVDKWMKYTAEYKAQVAGAFEIVGDESATIGKEYFASVSTEVVNTTNGFSDIKYSVKGELPAGVALDAETGELTGTPLETGVYNVTITVSAKKGNANLAFDVKHSFEVKADASAETGKLIAKIEKTGTEGLVDTYTITYTDGTTSTYTVTNGADVQAGSVDTTGLVVGVVLASVVATAALAGVVTMFVLDMKKKRNNK